MQTSDVFLVLATSLLSLFAGDTTASDLQRASVRERLALSWSALETLKFRCTVIQSETAPNSTPFGAQTFDFAFAPEGKRSMQYREDQVLSYDMRENGKTRCMTRYLRAPHENTRRIDAIHLYPQTDDATTYNGMMSPPLWLLMPGGIPLYRHADSGTISETRVVHGDQIPRPAAGVLEIVSNVKGTPVHIFLDKTYGFRPTKVIVERMIEVAATEFRNEGGQWFPSEGLLIWPEKGKFSWRLDTLAVNAKLDQAIFEPPAATEGALIRDAVTGKSRIIGGAQARNKLASQSGITRQRGVPNSLDANAPSRPHYSLILGCIVVLVGIGGGVAIGRSSRQWRRIGRG